MRKHLHFHIFAVAHVLVLVGLWIQFTWAHSKAADSSSISAQAPRGFCVRIERAIKRESRCFKHLVDDDQQQQDVVVTNRQAKGDNNNNNNNNSDDENSGAKNNNNKRARRRRKREEELVYVRLETLGAQLANLSTQVVNERVLESLLSELTSTSTQIGTQIGGFSLARSTSASTNDNENDDDNEQFRGRACQVAIEKFLCRLVYPSCHFRRSDASALVRPPCREDCLLMRDSICSNLRWSEVARQLQQAFNLTLNSKLGLHEIDLIVDGGGDSQNSQNSSSSAHFYWPHERAIENCESLPPLRATARRHQHHNWWPVCSDARLRETTTKGNHSECWTKSARGIDYLGTVNVTRSGRKCQSWASEEPHKHKLSKLLFDNMHEAHNYCRNPGGLELMPWCYTQDSTTRWEFCALKVC